VVDSAMLLRVFPVISDGVNGLFHVKEELEILPLLLNINVPAIISCLILADSLDVNLLIMKYLTCLEALLPSCVVTVSHRFEFKSVVVTVAVPLKFLVNISIYN
jgi:hypothetical protein